MLLGVPILALLSFAGACASLRHPSAVEDQTVEEPPKAWNAGISFSFPDARFYRNVDYSVRIEFFDGVRTRVVTPAALFMNDASHVATPWYRIRTHDRFPATLKVTLVHPGGAETKAEYPLSVRRDRFYEVYLAAYTRDRSSEMNPMAGPIPREVRGYPLNPAASTPPSDSLWISWVFRPKDCFSCPT